MILTLTIGSSENICECKQWKRDVDKIQIKSRSAFNLSPEKIKQFILSKIQYVLNNNQIIALIN
jgi:hypothetical protein